MSDGYELISDLFKDANGFRPSQMYMERFNAMPEAEKAEEWDYLCQKLSYNEEMKRHRQSLSVDEWEVHIEKLVAAGAGTIGNAIRWDMEAMDVDGDVGYYCWKWDIPYSKEAEIKELLAA